MRFRQYFKKNLKKFYERSLLSLKYPYNKVYKVTTTKQTHRKAVAKLEEIKMTNTNVVVETVAPKMSKMHMGIVVALEEIANGTYIVDAEEGTMHNAKTLKLIGSLDKPSGNVFYVIKGVDILAHRLLYAYYHGGIEVLNGDMVIKHLDENKANNSIGNLVQVPRKGWKQALADLKAGRTVEVSHTMEVVTEVEEGTQGELEMEVPVTLTAKEQEAVAIWNLLLEGKTIKEVAEALGLKTSRVHDVKRGKSNAKVTSQLQPLA